MTGVRLDEERRERYNELVAHLKKKGEKNKLSMSNIYVSKTSKKQLLVTDILPKLENSLHVFKGHKILKTSTG